MHVRQFELPQHVGVEIGPGDLAGRLGGQHVEDHPADTILADRREQLAEPRQLRTLGGRRLALTAEEVGRTDPAHRRREKDGREGAGQPTPSLAKLQNNSAGGQPEHDSQLGETGSPGKIGGAQPLGHQRSGPGVPGRPACHARGPIDGHDEKNRGDRHRSHEGGRQQGQEAHGLGHRRQHDPPAIGAQTPDGPGGAELQHRADHHRHGRHQPAGNLARRNRQHEGRQIGLADSDHHAGRHTVGGHGAQVFPHTAQGSLPVPLSEIGEWPKHQGARF